MANPPLGASGAEFILAILDSGAASEDYLAFVVQVAENLELGPEEMAEALGHAVKAGWTKIDTVRGVELDEQTGASWDERTCDDISELAAQIMDSDTDVAARFEYWFVTTALGEQVLQSPAQYGL